MINTIISFFALKKVLLPPKKREILIFDSTNSNEIIKLFDIKNYGILDIRNELNLFIIFKCLINLNLSKKLYINLYISYTNPKFIITYIDNDISFYEISNNFNGRIKTIFLQNGYRAIDNDIFGFLSNLNFNQSKKFKVDYMLTFGKSIGSEYSKYISGKVIDIGNIRNNKFHISKDENKIKNSILFISQWVNNSDSLNYKVNKIVTHLIDQFAYKNNLSLGILLRAKSDGVESEKIFFRNNIKNQFHFINKDKHKNSYFWIDKYELITTIDSTLGYESLARGNKTVFITIRDEIGKMGGNSGYNFGWPKNYEDKGVCWTNKNQKETIFKLLSNMFHIDKKSWKEAIIKNNFDDLIIYDKNNNKALKFFKTEITKNIN